jgi:hypothetical protein
MGAAIRCIVAAPAPLAHISGSRPPIVETTVIIFGRSRSTAPSITAA